MGMPWVVHLQPLPVEAYKINGTLTSLTQQRSVTPALQLRHPNF